MSELIHQFYEKLTTESYRKVQLVGLRWLAVPSLMILGLIVASTTTFAGEVDVVDVTISSSGGRNFQISATLKHGDTGWDHYANKWVVLDENGKQLGERILAHPHVKEQPFTRSVSVMIPETVKVVTIVAFDSEHEDGGDQMSIEVPVPQ